MFLLTVCHIVDHASGDIDEVHTTHHWPAEWEPLGEQGCLHALCWCCVGWVSCICGNLSSIITMATGFLKVSLYFAFMSFMLHVHMFPLYIMRRTYLAVKWVIAYSIHSEIRSLISTAKQCFTVLYASGETYLSVFNYMLYTYVLVLLLQVIQEECVRCYSIQESYSKS